MKTCSPATCSSADGGQRGWANSGCVDYYRRTKAVGVQKCRVRVDAVGSGTP